MVTTCVPMVIVETTGCRAVVTNIAVTIPGGISGVSVLVVVGGGFSAGGVVTSWLVVVVSC